MANAMKVKSNALLTVEGLAPYFTSLSKAVETCAKIQAERMREIEKHLVVITRRLEELKTAVESKR